MYTGKVAAGVLIQYLKTKRTRVTIPLRRSLGDGIRQLSRVAANRKGLVSIQSRLKSVPKTEKLNKVTDKSRKRAVNIKKKKKTKSSIEETPRLFESRKPETRTPRPDEVLRYHRTFPQQSRGMYSAA